LTARRLSISHKGYGNRNESPILLPAERLTLQQRNIVPLILRGRSNASIGETIGISEGTVRFHRKNIYRRLAISSQAELFRMFIDNLNQQKLY